MSFDSIVVIPDSQSIANAVGTYPIMAAQPKWCVDNEDAQKIGLVLHVGDFAEAVGGNEAMWTRIYSAYAPLIGAIPFVPAQGNHDPSDPEARALPGSLSAQMMNAVGSSTGYGMGDVIPTLGGTMQPGDWSNSWTIVTLKSGKQLLVLSIEFSTRTSTVAWAKGILDAHPGMLTVLLTHAWMDLTGALYNGTQTFDPAVYAWTASEGCVEPSQLETQLVQAYPQIRMVFAGHEPYSLHVHRTITRADGSKCHYLAQNYQWTRGLPYYAIGYQGNMLILRLYWDQDVIAGDVYSPWLHRYHKDDGLDPHYTADQTSQDSNCIRIRNAGIR